MARRRYAAHEPNVATHRDGGTVAGRSVRAEVMVGIVLATASCALLEPATEARDARVVVLVDATVSDAGMQDTQLQHVEEVVLPRAEREGAQVVIAAIDEDARAEPRIVDRPSFDPSPAEGNPRLIERIVAEAEQRAIEAATAVLTQERAAASDVVGALTWAAELLEGVEGWRAIAVVSDAVSTAPPCNMTLTPPSADEASVASCFPDGVPALAGVEVSFLGAGAYQEGDPAPVEAADLESFWRAVVAQGGGTVTDYGPLVLGEPAPSEEGEANDA